MDEDVCSFDVVDAGEERGNIAVASKCIIGEGTCVLREDPLVFSPSLLTISATGKRLERYCWACGAVLLSCADDWRRCQDLLGLGKVGEAVPAAMAALGELPYTTHTFGHDRRMYLCEKGTCASRARAALGVSYLLEHDGADDKCAQGSSWCGVPPLHIIAAMEFPPTATSSHWMPTSRRDAVEALWRVGATLNERVWVITRWICRLLAVWWQQKDAALPAPGTFDDAVGASLNGFAEGAPQSLNAERRGLLRYVTAVINVWLGTTPRGDHKCTSPPPHVTLQTILRMVWALDANSHTYIILSPIFTWYQRRCVYGDDANASGDAGGGEQQQQQLLARRDAEQQVESVLEDFFSGDVDHNMLHASGVALYSRGSKINHACAPNVRFLPSPRNRVEALGVLSQCESLQVGDELFISYIDNDSAAMQTAAVRRELLERNYGFVCQCSRCTADA